MESAQRAKILLDNLEKEFENVLKESEIRGQEIARLKEEVFNLREACTENGSPEHLPFSACSSGQSGKSASEAIQTGTQEQRPSRQSGSRHSGHTSVGETGNQRSSFIAYQRFAAENTADDLGGIGNETTSVLQRMIKSGKFDLTVAMLLVLNTVSMMFEMQYKGMETGYDASMAGYGLPAGEAWPYADTAFIVINTVFNIMFTIEMFIRIYFFRCQYFKEKLSYLDMVCILVGWTDSVMQESGYGNPMVVRLIRVARLARGIRMIKIGSVLESLHILTKSICASFYSVSASLVCLLYIQCVVGMALSTLVHHIIVNANGDLVGRTLVFNYYGTFSRSQITMFEVHMANFGPPCRVLIDHCGVWYGVFFVLYRCIFGFAILNVITSIFIQQTMSVVQRDEEFSRKRREREVKVYANELRNLFKRLDKSNDGLISFEELQRVKAEPEIVHWLNTLEMGSVDLGELFTLLDVNGDGHVSLDELVSVAPRIKGTARSIDMLSVLINLEQLKSVISAIPLHFHTQQGGQVPSPEEHNGCKRSLLRLCEL